MTLRNLLNTGQLAEHETDAVQVRRMLVAAQRSIDDAKNETISPETRLDAAYRAIMQPLWFFVPHRTISAKSFFEHSGEHGYFAIHIINDPNFVFASV